MNPRQIYDTLSKTGLENLKLEQVIRPNPFMFDVVDDDGNTEQLYFT